MILVLDELMIMECYSSDLFKVKIRVGVGGCEDVCVCIFGWTQLDFKVVLSWILRLY